MNKKQLVGIWLSVPEEDKDSDPPSMEQGNSGSEYQPSEPSTYNSNLRPFEDSPSLERDQALNICEDSNQSEVVPIMYPMLVEEQLRKNYLFTVNL